MKTNQARAKAIIDAVVGSQAAARLEATVRRPPRSRNFVAVYTGVEPGTQTFRSTGLSDETAAQELAKEWEAQARREREQRKAQAKGQRQPSRGTLGLSQREVATILRISERGVRNIERRALAKLRQHPALKAIWREFRESQPGLKPLVASAAYTLTQEEADALLLLARTPFELRVLKRLLALVLPPQPRS